MAGVLHLEGEEVEVDELTYDWLIKSYLEERKQQLEQVEKLDELTKTVIENTSKRKRKIF